MKANLFKYLFILLAVGVLYAAWLARRASSDRVTLNVRNAPLASVMRSLRWQTWEHFLLKEGTDGSVTLNVKDVPLKEVLGMIAEQINGDWNSIYSLSTSASSKRELDAALAKGSDSIPGWADLGKQMRPSPAIMFARNTASALSDEVTLNVTNKPAREVAAGFARFGRALVLVDDSCTKNVSLSLNQISMEKAVQNFAAALGKKSGQRYFLAKHAAPRFKTPPRHSDGDTMLNAELDGPLREKFARGEPVTIALGDRPPGDAPIQMEHPPMERSPGEARLEVGGKMLESTRNSTPEQRAERWRNMKKLPAPPVR